MTADRSTSPHRESSEPSLPDKVVAIHRQLEVAKLPHAIGGALALAYYAEPRATVDVDVNVFVSSDRWPAVCAALAKLGIDVEVDRIALERDEQVRLWWGRNAVDLFFSYNDFHAAMPRKARKVPFGDTTLTILSPEHLAVCKAMFDRTKDWLDIEQILVAADPVDLSEIETWLRRMVGDDDPRLDKLATVTQRLGLSAGRS